jgi:alanine racemase
MDPPDRVPTALRPTRLIVDRQIIAQNAATIRSRISDQTMLMAVVKANGYGHGAVESARAAIDGGASFLGVATVAEGCELRDAGIETPVLVLGSSSPLEAPRAASNAIAIGVGDATQIGLLLEVLAAAKLEHPLTIHLKVDTGMRRFGVSPGQAPAIALEIASHPSTILGGIYSHFAESDAETQSRLEVQLETFLQFLVNLADRGIDRGIAHISNSAALLRNRHADLDMVRAGICLYGISPSEHVPLFSGMRPALEWRAIVQHITEMAPGDRTGYGGTYVASGQERLALLPVGYADGYPRHLSNRGWIGYQGRRLPVRGRISMDQFAVGIPEAMELSVGDEVTLLGRSDSGAPDANQLGALIDSIGYEIVARISPRVPVQYL